MLVHVNSLDLPSLRKKKLWSEILTTVNAFKAACLFHPAKVTNLQPDTIMKSLSVFTF